MLTQVRVASAGDLPAIQKLASESSTAAQWSDDAYQSLFQSNSPIVRHVLVAEEGGAVLGFVAARRVDSEWELENVAVAAASRQRGIGKLLVGELLKLSQSHGATAIHLEVRESNRAARCLYQSCGFHETGRRKAYYAGPAEDGVQYSFSFSSPEK